MPRRPEAQTRLDLTFDVSNYKLGHD